MAGRAAKKSAPVERSPIEIAQERIAHWRHNPGDFVRQVFHVKPTDYQEEALKALVEHGHVSIRSGHGTGKSALDAWAIILTMTCFYPTRIPCTAPTGHQLDDILWKELATWHQAMDPNFKKFFEHTARRFDFKSGGGLSFAVARTSSRDNPEALQGFHSRDGALLFVLDEASGIHDKVFEVSEGALSTKGSRVLMTSNPTRRRGYFYDSHHMFKDEYACFQWNSEESPLVDPAYCKRMARKYGKDSNIYRVRVLGEFPRQEGDAVVDIDSVLNAQGRDVDPVDGPVLWGVDVARGGKDRSVLVKRRMNIMLEAPTAWRGKDSEQLADLIVQEYEKAEPEDKPDEIIIDMIGLGAGVYDILFYRDFPVVGVNVSERASAHDRYNRLRDELWAKCAHWFNSGAVRIPTQPGEIMTDFIDELTSIKYDDPTPQGKTKVQSKIDIMNDDTATRMNSPDLADAFVLTFRSYIKPDAILRRNKAQNWRNMIRKERPRLQLL